MTFLVGDQVMDGEARYAWQHYIPHRKFDDVPGAPGPTKRPKLRVSVTLRKVPSHMSVDTSAGTVRKRARAHLSTVVVRTSAGTRKEGKDSYDRFFGE